MSSHWFIEHEDLMTTLTQDRERESIGMGDEVYLNGMETHMVMF